MDRPCDVLWGTTRRQRSPPQPFQDQGAEEFWLNIHASCKIHHGTTSEPGHNWRITVVSLKWYSATEDAQYCQPCAHSFPKFSDVCGGWTTSQFQLDPGRAPDEPLTIQFKNTTTRELQTCTFQGPGASNTTKIPRKDPQERERRMKIVVGEGIESAKFWAPHHSGPPFGAPPFGAHPFGAPPFGAPPFGAPPFGPTLYRFGPPPFGASTFRALIWGLHPSGPHRSGPTLRGHLLGPTLCGPKIQHPKIGRNRNWPKSKLAEVEIGRSRNWPKSKLPELEKKSWPKSKLAEVDRARGLTPPPLVKPQRPSLDLR